MGSRAKHLGTTGIYYNNTSSEESHGTYDNSQYSNKSPNSQDNLASGASDQYHPIKCILDETRRKYLIAWEGQYRPTWEPKHFANREAVRVWKQRRERRLFAAAVYQNSRQPRRCKQAQQQALGPSSGDFSGHSTVPDSQEVTSGSTNADASESTQPSSSEVQSQGSSLSGSLFCPGSSNLASHISEVSRTQQSLQQDSQSRSSCQSSSLYKLSQSGAGSCPSTLNSLSGNFSITSIELSSQSQQTTSRSSVAQQRSLSFPSFIYSTAINSQSTPSGPRLTGRSIFEREEFSAHHISGAVEIEETPPSRLQVGRSTSSGRSDTRKTNHITRSASANEAIQTPIAREQLFNRPTAIQAVPETDYRNQSSSTPKRLLLRQLSNPECSPSVASPSFDKRRRSWTEGDSSTKATPHLSDWRNNLHLPEEIAPQERDTRDLSAAMDNPTRRSNDNDNGKEGNDSNNNTGRPSFEPDTAPRSSGVPLRDRLSALRNAERATIQPLQSVSGSATPSSAGDIEPTTAPAHPATASPLSVRVEKEHTVQERVAEPPQTSPVPFVAPQALHYTVEDDSAVVPGYTKEPEPELAETRDLDIPIVVNLEEAEAVAGEPAAVQSPPPVIKGLELGPSEFAIPLPMDSRVKDDYDNALDSEGRTIPKFLEMSDQEATSELRGSSMVLIMREMIDQLDNICTHPDLNLSEPPNVNVNDIAREASWAEYSSSKFVFLGYFIDAASDQDLHVMIMVKQDRAVKIMETYLLAKGFSLRVAPSDNPDESEKVFYRGTLSFGVRTTSDERLSGSSRRPTLVIAMDSSFNADNEVVEQLRMSSTPDKLVPVVRLVIANTTEHIKLCLPHCSDLMKLRLAVKYTHIYRTNVGELQDDALGVQEDAEEIFSYLTAEPSTRKWPLPMIEELDIHIREDDSSPYLEGEELRSMTTSRQKRWLEGEADESANPSKRQRMTPLQDVTHISDSMKGQTQGSVGEQGKSTTIELAQEVEKLRSALDDAQERLKTTEANLSSLQHRYETKHKKLHKTRQDLDAALEGAKKSESRIEKQKDEIMKLKDDKTTLIKELDEARNAVKEGGGTSADLEKSQEESRKLTAENEKLQRTVNQERSQSEYTRQQYQNASSAAAQSALEVRQLEEEIQELKSKASDEARQLKQLKLQNDSKADLARIEELEATITSRDQLLEKKDEELTEMRKNRHTTRATSMQPRSPKWGPSRPSSPGPSSNAVPRASSALRFRAE